MRATRPDKPDYDTARATALLVICQQCGKAYYMTHPQPVCVLCRIAAAK